MTQRRIRLTVRYDGTGFSGSQIQPEGRTVSGTLTECLKSLLGQEVHLLWAGRTDAGVHANGNVCAFDANPAFPVEKLPQLLRALLPDDLVVVDSTEAEAAFHPRFDALKRVYSYRVYRGADIPVDRYRYCAQYTGAWDAAAVSLALGSLAGEHCFRNYSLGCNPGDSAMCTLDPVVTREAGPELAWWFSGNRFLRHMICRLAGVLLAVAGGTVKPEQIAAGLTGEPDFKFSPAPPRGLTLERVEYQP